MAVAVISDVLDIFPDLSRLPPPPPPPGLPALPKLPPLPKPSPRPPDWVPSPPTMPPSLRPPTPNEILSFPREAIQLIPIIGDVHEIIHFFIPSELINRMENAPMDAVDKTVEEGGRLFATGFKDVVSRGGDAVTDTGKDAVEFTRESATDVARAPIEEGGQVARTGVHEIGHKLLGGGLIKECIDAVTEFQLERQLGAQPTAELLKPLESNIPLFPSHLIRVLMSRQQGGGQQ